MDAEFFDFLERSADAILARDPACLRHVVAHSCRLKAQVVSQDEREETGGRARLNFGHTVAHAVESVSGCGPRYHHGEAVAVGMVAECRLAERLGWIDAGVTERVRALAERFRLPIRATGLEPDALIEVMTRDKKNQKGKTRFVLPRRIGHVELTDAPLESHVREVMTT
jgi:3-dehydroquinate synthase